MVVPVDVIVDQDEHLVAGALLPTLGIDGFRLHTPEEPLRGGVVRRTALRAHRPRQPVPFHEIQPSGPPVMAAAVGMHQGFRPLRQCFRGLDEHPVGELRVGAEIGRVRDDLAVVAVDHRREVHLPIPGLDLGDVREPLLVRPFGHEVAVDEVAGCGCGLALVGAVSASFGHMRDESVLGHDPADHLLRDAGSERGLDPAVPVPALGRGERLRHLRPESGVSVNAEPGVVVVVAARRDAEQACHRVE